MTDRDPNESDFRIVQNASSVMLTAIVLAIGLALLGLGAGLGVRAFCWVSGLC